MKSHTKEALLTLMLSVILVLSLTLTASADEVITETVTTEVEEAVEETTESEDETEESDEESDEEADNSTDDEEEEDADVVESTETVTNVTEINEIVEVAEEEVPVEPVAVNVLILPKFEVGAMSGDDPGEAQFYYDAYLSGGNTYKVQNASEGSKLYYKDGVALFVTGMGKVNAAQNLMALLTDPNFDFSNAYILSTGCAGGAVENTVLGDVCLITGVADFDLGHHADPRDMEDPDKNPTWFHSDHYDASAYRLLNGDLISKVYPMIKDVPCASTEKAKKDMAENFDNAEWALRDPAVIKGSSVTGDNYWAGTYDEANARLIVDTYPMADPYVATEMEDIAVAVTADRTGLMNRLIILRNIVNMDVYEKDMTPEKRWGAASNQVSDDSDDSDDGESLFNVSMENNFNVGRVIVDAILNGEL